MVPTSRKHFCPFKISISFVGRNLLFPGFPYICSRILYLTTMADNNNTPDVRLFNLADEAYNDVLESILADLSDEFEERELPKGVDYTDDYLYYMATEMEKAGMENWKTAPILKESREIIAEEVKDLTPAERFALQNYFDSCDLGWQEDDDLVESIVYDWAQALLDFKRDTDEGVGV